MGLGLAQFKVQFLLSTLSAPTNYYVAGLLQPNQMELTSDDHRDDVFFHQGHDDQARRFCDSQGLLPSWGFGCNSTVYRPSSFSGTRDDRTLTPFPHELLPPEIANPILTPRPLHEDVTWR